MGLVFATRTQGERSSGAIAISSGHVRAEPIDTLKKVLEQVSPKAHNLACLCSNEKCPDRSKHPQGTACGTCGSPVKEYRYGNLFRHLSTKSKSKVDAEAKQKKDVKHETRKKEDLLQLPEMTDEEIEEAIRRDLRNVSSRHEWMDLPDLLESGDIDSPEDRLLSTLIDHSKILIRQNELILRILRRMVSQIHRQDVTETVKVAS